MSFSVDRALKHRVVLLGGDEEILLRRALIELLGEVAPEGDDFDLITMEADVTSPIDWLGAAGTAPFLAPRRTCVVRHLLRHDEPDALKLDSLPEYALLVLVADEEIGDEAKQGKLKRLRTQWVNHVKSGGGHVEMFAADSKALPGMLRKEAEALGAALTPPAALLLAEMVGGSLSRGLGELEKLVLFIGDERQIGEKIVREVATPSREWNVFRLVEMVASGDVGGALQQLQILVVSPTKAEDAAYSRILPNLHRQVRLLWQARILVEAKASPDSIPAHLAAQMTESPSFAKEPPYRQSKLMTVARQTSFSSLAAALQIVADADAKLKGMLPAFSAMETLEEAILMLAKELRPMALA